MTFDLQTAGEVQYVDDLPTIQQELFAVVVPSQYASGRLVEVRTDKAKVGEYLISA